MSKTAIARAYAVPFLLMSLVGLLAISMNDGPVDIARKMVLVPMFLLAMRGVRTFFPEAKDESRSLLTHLEFQLLASGLQAVFVVLIATPGNDEALSQMARFVVLMTLGMAAVNMVLFWQSRRSHPKRNDAGSNLTNL
ncbi:hypothetical protein [Rhizobium sp. Leaf341]|uniref:hypothetical protein n=1 Tax=Rhizobium sp. Leaf341 TaxID=1736344 RepID=UPI00071413BA|nr:hypothetical protein [Rhizobium sp. Leaf341]KQR78134.1 hypothetical protein ASG03_17615 [Rhizobium sp. Leaf341]